MTPTSSAVSVPGRPLQAQYRTASDPNSSSVAMGVITLPFDFDIFLRSLSRIQPLMVACRHGRTSCSRCERSSVEKSQVRMISGPCGRRSMGNVAANSAGSSSQPQAICGVTDEVAHVSRTSGSPVNPPATPRCSGV